MTFTDDKDGSTKTIKIPIGENLLEAAHKNDIDLEGTHVYISYFLEIKPISLQFTQPLPLFKNFKPFFSKFSSSFCKGACEGSLACSTCHVIVEDEDYFERIPEPDDDENDMLDLAFGLTDTSRLGCQVKAAKELDGLKVRIPSATRNFAVDGHVPKPH